VSNLKRLTRGLLMYASDWDRKLPSTSDCAQPLGGDTRHADPFGTWIPQDPRHWCWKVLPYVHSRDLFRCPAVPTRSDPGLPPPGATPDYNSYAMNGVLSNHNGEGGLSLEAVPHPGDIVALQECGQASTGCNNESPKWEHMGCYSSGWALSWSSLPMQPPHPPGANYSFADGHVSFLADGTQRASQWGLTPDTTNQVWGPWTAGF